MKIAFLIQDITTQGGTERTTCCVAAELRRRGHDVSIVSVFHNEQQPHYTAEEVPIYYLTNATYSAKKSALYRLMQVIMTRGKARKCPVLEEADAIICQKVLASTVAYLAGYKNKSIAAEHFAYGMYTPWLRKMRHRLYRRMRAVVTLTDKAVSVMSELEAGRSLKQEQLVKGMSETEIAEASRLLRKMLDNLDQQ